MYRLDKGERTRYRELAHGLYDAGATVASAEAARATRLDGFLYAITNPAWPGCVKIGRAFDADSRHNGYQTGSPYRDYELAFVGDYFEDCVAQEKRVHAMLAEHRLQGEWFAVSLEQAIRAISSVSPFRAAA